MKSNKILYIGRFEMPDKDATANRVMANAKLLRKLGYEVIFFGWSNDLEQFQNTGIVKKEYDGFTCYEKKAYTGKSDRLNSVFDAHSELEVIKSIGDLGAVIAYNFPAVALDRIFAYCKRKGILRLCDVTEWHGAGKRNLLIRLVRAFDSSYRMKVVHKKADGLIVISKYLENYYKSKKTVLVPPLVDLCDDKWDIEAQKDDTCKLVYVGWPSRAKERLDLVIDAVKGLPEDMKVALDIYGITYSQYCSIYGIEDKSEPDRVTFHGRVPHREALSAVKSADYSLVIRESNRKNNAGFPSKLVECISCGTAVLTTDISNVRDYVGDGKNGYIISIDSLSREIARAVSTRNEITVEKETFDYNKFTEKVAVFLKGLEIN